MQTQNEKLIAEFLLCNSNANPAMKYAVGIPVRDYHDLETSCPQWIQRFTTCKCCNLAELCRGEKLKFLFKCNEDCALTNFASLKPPQNGPKERNRKSKYKNPSIQEFKFTQVNVYFKWELLQFGKDYLLNRTSEITQSRWSLDYFSHH